MSNRISFQQEWSLREQLQRDAAATRPDFSESLHQKIVASVDRYRAFRLTENGGEGAGNNNCHSSSMLRLAFQNTSISRSRILAASALASACTVALVLLGWPILQRGMQQDLTDQHVLIAQSGVIDPISAVALAADLASFDASVNDASHPLHRLLGTNQVTTPTDALKDDLKLAAVSVIERLPVDVDLVVRP